MLLVTGDTRSSLLPTARKFKTSVSFTITMGANRNRNSTLTEPNSIKVLYFKLINMTFPEKNLH